jgi:hypothetical protein
VTYTATLTTVFGDVGVDLSSEVAVFAVRFAGVVWPKAFGARMLPVVPVVVAGTASAVAVLAQQRVLRIEWVPTLAVGSSALSVRAVTKRVLGVLRSSAPLQVDWPVVAGIPVQVSYFEVWIRRTSVERLTYEAVGAVTFGRAVLGQVDGVVSLVVDPVP